MVPQFVFSRYVFELLPNACRVLTADYDTQLPIVCSRSLKPYYAQGVKVKLTMVRGARAVDSSWMKAKPVFQGDICGQPDIAFITFTIGEMNMTIEALRCSRFSVSVSKSFVELMTGVDDRLRLWLITRLISGDITPAVDRNVVKRHMQALTAQFIQTTPAEFWDSCSVPILMNMRDMGITCYRINVRKVLGCWTVGELIRRYNPSLFAINYSDVAHAMRCGNTTLLSFLYSQRGEATSQERLYLSLEDHKSLWSLAFELESLPMVRWMHDNTIGGLLQKDDIPADASLEVLMFMKDNGYILPTQKLVARGHPAVIRWLKTDEP